MGVLTGCVGMRGKENKMTPSRRKARTGTIYRRWKNKRYKIDDPEALGKGKIWLRYKVDGEAHDESLGTADIDEAKMKQAQIMRPLELANKEEVLDQTRLRLERVQKEKMEEREKQTPPLKLSEAWQAYERSQNRPRSGRQTLSGYAGHYKKFKEWMDVEFPEVVYMRNVGIRQAEAYAEHMSSQKLSPSTYNQKLNALALMWNVLAEKAYTSTNPFAWDKKARKGIQRRSVKAEAAQRKKRPLTPEEIDEVLKKAKGDYRTLIMILVCTGQRLVDGVKLEWKSINFEKRVITLIPIKTASRTGKTVHIPLFQQLERELATRKKTGRYVLPKLVKQYDSDQTVISKDLKTIFEDADIETEKVTDLETDRVVKDVGSHSLRHSFVTIARMAGFPDPLISQISGHSSQEMIDHYTQFSDDMVASLAGQLLGNKPSAQKALSFKEMAKEPLPKRATERIKDAMKLTEKITGKKNGQVVEEVNKILNELIS
jgi:integrase